eukprot:816129-Rhodomonas_salina.1
MKLTASHRVVEVLPAPVTVELMMMGVSSVLTAFRIMALTASRSISGSALTLGQHRVPGFCVEDPELSELELKGRSGGGPPSLET